MDRETILRRVVLKCRDLCRQLAYHRALLPHVEGLRANIWIYTFNNFIEMAVLDWCHLFGNRNGELHWRQVIGDQEDFKMRLLAAIRLNEEEWTAYWESVKAYRDEDIAHIRIKPNANVPDMELALQAACFFYDSIINELMEIETYRVLPAQLSQHYEEVAVLAETYVDENVVDLLEYVEDA